MAGPVTQTNPNIVVNNEQKTTKGFSPRTAEYSPTPRAVTNTSDEPYVAPGKIDDLTSPTARVKLNVQISNLEAALKAKGITAEQITLLRDPNNIDKVTFKDESLRQLATEYGNIYQVRSTTTDYLEKSKNLPTSNQVTTLQRITLDKVKSFYGEANLAHATLAELNKSTATPATKPTGEVIGGGAAGNNNTNNAEAQQNELAEWTRAYPNKAMNAQMAPSERATLGTTTYKAKEGGGFGSLVKSAQKIGMIPTMPSTGGGNAQEKSVNWDSLGLKKEQGILLAQDINKELGASYERIQNDTKLTPKQKQEALALWHERYESFNQALTSKPSKEDAIATSAQLLINLRKEAITVGAQLFNMSLTNDQLGILAKKTKL